MKWNSFQGGVVVVVSLPSSSLSLLVHHHDSYLMFLLISLAEWFKGQGRSRSDLLFSVTRYLPRERLNKGLILVDIKGPYFGTEYIPGCPIVKDLKKKTYKGYCFRSPF